VEHISSRQNPLVGRFRALAHERRNTDEILLDGRHLIEEALASTTEIVVAALLDRRIKEDLADLAARIEAAGATAVTVSEKVLSAVSPVREPSGAVAIARRATSTLATVLRRAPALVAVLDDVQDPGNVGAIIRAAEAFGATGIVTAPGAADPLGWKALRGSMGSALRIPIAVRVPLPEAIRASSDAGLRVFATVPHGGTPLTSCDLTGPAVVLLGAEGTGLSAAAIGAADQRLTIPMCGPPESLNVAVAAGVILYEASRQRVRMQL
jgi:TrmH family RNA methyltransferase